MEVKQLNNFDEMEVVAASLRPSGVFQSVSYLKTFDKNFPGNKLLLGVFEKGEVVGYGGFEIVGEEVVFLGMKPVMGREEVSDFGEMVYEKGKGKAVFESCLKWFKNEGYKKVRLDYVREDSESFEFLKTQGKIEVEEVSPYIILPSSFDEYLKEMQRKYRKELKRKIKRLEEKKSFYECSEESVSKDFEEFVRLHRLSDPAKSKFMSEKMKKFFWEVKMMRIEGWESSLCFLKLDEKVVASVMTFESKEEMWLYNSGYDPEYSYYSVGLLLKSYKIKQAIESGKKKYDFLRGNERYKYEMGAKDLRLYKIEISL